MNIPKSRFSGDISPQSQVKLNKILQQENCSKGELIEKLLDLYDFQEELTKKSEKIQFGELSYHNLGLEVKHNQDGSLKENQIEVVDHAIKNSGLSFKQIVRDGTLQRARYLNSIAKNQAKLDTLTENQLKEQTFKGVASYRITQAIEKLKNHNNNQTQKINKFCITKGMVFKLTGSNRQTINQFFATHQTEIADHNQKHQLTDKDNRKGKNFSFKEVLGLA